MKKNPIQDIKRSTPSMHAPAKSVRPKKETTKKKVHEKDTEEVYQVEEPFSFEEKLHSDHFIPSRNAKRSLKVKTFAFIFGVLALFVAIYFISLKYGHATVYITPKQEAFTFKDQSFSAIKTGQDNVSFEVMIISDKLEKDITLTESKQTSSKAAGTVVIYNEFSTKAQKLSINTRLVDDSGNIYFTDKALSIPGYTMSGKKVVPGSVSVGITASNAGVKYNGDPRDFTLLGFKGTPKATKIYARSKGSISGGSTGLMYTPSPEQKGELNTLVNTELKSKLQKNIQAQLPPNYILFEDSIKFDSNFNPDNILSPEANAKIVAEGSVTAVILNQRDLEKNVISTVNKDIKDNEIEEISIPEIKNFVFKISDSSLPISKQTSQINFTLTGSGTLSWSPNFEKITEQLVGVKKDDADNIFLQDPGIEKVRMIFTPPWQKTLPTNSKYIKIKSE